MRVKTATVLAELGLLYLYFEGVSRGTINGVLREAVPESYSIREEAPLVDQRSGKKNYYLHGMSL